MDVWQAADGFVRVSDHREIRLPEELCNAALTRFGARFKTVEELLEFVLQELLRDDADRLDAAEQQMIEERLRELGYM